MLAFLDETAPHQVGFSAYGVSARICANEPDLIPRAQRYLPPGSAILKASRDQHRLGIMSEGTGKYSVFDEGMLVTEGQTLELALLMLETRIRGYVALHTPDRTFVHAGAVAYEGRGVLIPGHSFTGKSTLTAALVRIGATYYSDEFAVLDDEGLLHPYAKSIDLRQDPNTQAPVDVEELGGESGQEPVPIGMVIVTMFHPGIEWNPRRISVGEAALSLITHTATLWKRPQEAMKAMSRALSGAIAFEGERGEADDVAPRLLEELAAVQS
jgi:hypothetical protein